MSTSPASMCWSPAGWGLGMATARGLLRRGASVHLRAAAPCWAAAAAQLRRESLPGAVRLSTRPRDPRTGGCRDSSCPRVDVLIHNAGILPAARGHTKTASNGPWR